MYKKNIASFIIRPKILVRVTIIHFCSVFGDDAKFRAILLAERLSSHPLSRLSKREEKLDL